jgi:8-oxo-dGTP diphosphatase
MWYKREAPKNEPEVNMPSPSETDNRDVELIVNLVIVGLRQEKLKVLLVALSDPRVEGQWCLPGSPISHLESLDQTATRLLKTLTGMGECYIEQLYTYGDTGRDPRRRSISCAYLGLLPAGHRVASAADETDPGTWFSVDQVPKLALDHMKILSYALRRLRYKLEYTAVGFQLLPEEFTLSELQKAYEIILGERLDKRNFRRRILAANVIEPTPHYRTSEGRPARLYHYRADAVAEVKARRLFP